MFLLWKGTGGCSAVETPLRKFKAHVAFPAKLSRQITSRQVKDPIYSLALAIRNNLKNGSEESRYLYLLIFRFKSESIVTQF